MSNYLDDLLDQADEEAGMVPALQGSDEPGGDPLELAEEPGTCDDLDAMSKAELLDLAAKHGVEIKNKKKTPVAYLRELLKDFFLEGAAPGVTAGSDEGDEDLIQATAHYVENLDQEAALREVHELHGDVEFSYFKLGGILAVIQDKGWFGDHPNFKAWVEAETSLKYRKAAYLTSIYNGLLESGVTWNQVKCLGWSKLIKLLPILTAENADELVAKCFGLTVVQIGEYVKALIAAGENGKATEPSTEVSVMTFKVHEDQKEVIKAAIEACKAKTSTESAAVALTYICTDYAAGPTKAKKVSVDSAIPAGDPEALLAKIFAETGAIKVLGIFEKVFPNFNITVEEADEVEVAVDKLMADTDLDDALF